MSSTELAPNAYAQSERRALSQLLLQTGPDAPTLCEGWAARELVGHLAVREGRNLPAAFGIFLGPLKSYSAKKQRQATEGPWSTAVDRIRNGPPKGTMAHRPKIDSAMNTVEYFVHHEDLRRGAPGWEPRVLPADQAEDLWTRLSTQVGKRLTRKSPVGVRIRHTDGREAVVHEGHDTVTLVGDPAELVLHLFGRSASRVDVQGDPAAAAKLADALGV
jgi:uncharacterized protein (TIGR03085 family)